MRYAGILVFLCAVAILSGAEIKGTGFGKTPGEAKRYALSDLSSYIEVEVKSMVMQKTSQTGSGKDASVSQTASSSVETRSDIPVLGASYSTETSGDQYICTAVLDTAKALPLYQDKIRLVVKKIADSGKSLESKVDTVREREVLNSLLVDMRQFEKLLIAARFLGDTQSYTLSYTESDIRDRLSRISGKADTLEAAAKLIAERVKVADVFVYPPSVSGSGEITQFAGVFRDYLSGSLRVVTSYDRARYFLKGTYVILDNGISMTYQLTDTEAAIVAVIPLYIAPQAYSGYTVKPVTIDFSKAIAEGFAVSADFKIDVMTNNGADNLLFKDGQEIELFIKMNKPGYFYGVGHVTKESEKYSYLLEVNPESSGDRKFISFVNADDVNKWISLGAFEVAPPYGMESLQFIASNADLSGKLPAYQYDRKTEYYLLPDSPAENVLKTRGLKPAKTKQVTGAEAILVFTTLP